MSYHGLGAGPGPVETYYVDMPFPWGDDTELRLPVYALTQDVVRNVQKADLASLVPWDSINRRLEVSMPLWIDQANELAKPHIDAYINSALLKFAGITAVLIGGAFFVATRIAK
jgi:hypothetical protein